MSLVAHNSSTLHKMDEHIELELADQLAEPVDGEEDNYRYISK